jgi:hypothetical protein
MKILEAWADLLGGGGGGGGVKPNPLEWGLKYSWNIDK